MTRKDYNALASVIRDERMELLTGSPGAEAIDSLAHRIADVCTADNPRFDRDRFLIACGVPRA